jgi:Uma2 family endonuclease
LLLIEVAESSLDYDRGEKVRLYADSGIHDYWVVNLIDRMIEVRRDPAAGCYRSVQMFGSGESVQPLAAPGAQLRVDDLFGPSA